MSFITADNVSSIATEDAMSASVDFNDKRGHQKVRQYS
jgi:hypothetical protein